jgi:membrane-bound inhibitor of C-type lysozyme
MKKLIAFFLLMFTSLISHAQIFGLTYDAYVRSSGAYISSGTVPNLNYDWGGGYVLNTGMYDNVQIYFNGYIKWPGTPGSQQTVTFYSRNDDGFYLNISNVNVIDSWRDQGPNSWNGVGSITLTGGEVYQLSAWFYENGGGAVVQLYWDIGNGIEIVPQAVLGTDSTVFAPSYSSNITESQTIILNAARSRTNNTSNGNTVYIDQQMGSTNNSVTVDQYSSRNVVGGLNGSQYAILSGSNNTVTVKQGDPTDLTGKNLTEFAINGNNNTVTLKQGIGISASGVDYRDGHESGGHYIGLSLSGSYNTVGIRQSNDGGQTSGHFANLSVSGDNNRLTLTQSNDRDKKFFGVVTGNYNVFDVIQQGSGNHYLDVSLTGNGHSLNINQKDSGTHKATINLTNAGGASTINLLQQGATNQMYSVTQQCANLNGCNITVTQGQ